MIKSVLLWRLGPCQEPAGGCGSQEEQVACVQMVKSLGRGQEMCLVSWTHSPQLCKTSASMGALGPVPPRLCLLPGLRQCISFWFLSWTLSWLTYDR